MRHPLVFLGTAELACATLRGLAGSPNYDLRAVVTQPDKPRGRALQVQPSPVKAVALELGLPVLQPRRARDESFIQQIRDLAPALMVVVAYGQILPQTLLDVPVQGSLNVHTSLLPRHRGAAPIQWSILSGDSETGVTIMKMDAGLDTGPILTQRHTPITADDNSQTLHDRLARIGAELLLETLPQYLNGQIKPSPQPADAATYARKIEKTDGQVSWEEPAEVIWRKVRAFTPWPGAFTFYNEADTRRMLKIWDASPREGNGNGPAGTVLEADSTGIQVACGKGSLALLTIQPEGRRRMSAREFLAGRKAPQAFA